MVGWMGATLSFQPRGLPSRHEPQCPHNTHSHVCSFEDRRGKKPKVGVDIPTPDEIRVIIAAAKGRWRPVLLTAIFGGLRASELRGLRWQDIDLKKGELHVRQRADKFRKIGPPKSEAGERTVPLPLMVVNTLREWRLACPKGELDLAFPNGKGDVEFHNNVVYCGLWPTLIAAGVIIKTESTPAYTRCGTSMIHGASTGRPMAA